MKERLNELDSMRGLAALTVVIGHLMLIDTVISNPTWGVSGHVWLNVIKYTPLHVFWAGDEAVIFFFVLSGFVLALPFYEKKPSYIGFLVRRVCRIYLPYIAAVALALVARELFDGRVAGMSGWFSNIWSGPVTGVVLVQHLILIGKLKVNVLDPPIWSLSQEMRISLIFPLLMILVANAKWIWSLLFGVAMALFSFRHGLDTPSGTLNYTLFFVLGAVLAKHRSTLMDRLKKMSRVSRLICISFALVLYTFRWWTFGFLPRIPVIDYWIVAVGVCIFIVMALSSPVWKRVLSFKPIHYVGKISYSLYLFHMIVVTAIVHELGGNHLIFAALVSLVVSLLLATMMYYWVEVPSIRLGRYLSGRLSMRVSGVVLPNWRR